jgi:hypothetical protein
MSSANTVKGLLQYMIDNGIPITTTIADLITIEQPDASKLNATVTNAILEKKCKPFNGTANFSRPEDSVAYTIGDAISDSTSAPTIMTLDLSSYGVVEDDFVAITNAYIVVSTKLGNSSWVELFVSAEEFAATNDNEEFALSDSEAQKDSIVLSAQDNIRTANNTILRTSILVPPIIKVTSSKSLYCALHANLNFAVDSGSRFDIFINGVIL